MKSFIKFLILIPLLTIKLGFTQQQLAPNSPEIKQLEAMGYDIEKSSTKSGYTVASTGKNKISFTKNDDRMIVTRSFIREKKLNSDQEIELLKIVNQLNIDLAFQVYVDQGSLTMNLYLFGSHDPKTFAKVVRLSELAATIFDTRPELLKLLNN